MKKSILLSVVLLMVLQVRGQIVNPGFEQRNADGTPAYWLPLPIGIILPTDTVCIWNGADSIGFVTTDAHTGNYAYELRTATYCDSMGMSGNIRPTKYNVDSGFVDQRIPFTQRPAAFEFYYKLTAAGDDYAMITALLENDNGPVASGIVKLRAQAPNWSLGSVPMVYHNTDTPAYLTITFRLENDSFVHYGTRFLIDDLGSNDQPTRTTCIQPASVSVKCYPVPATGELNIQLPEAMTATTSDIRITDAAGRVVSKQRAMVNGNHIAHVNVAELPGGIYFLTVTAGDTISRGRFVK